MPLINTSLSNLIQGVSQQPDAIRFPGQCAVQENALSSIVDGLQKRPSSEFIKTLLQTESLDANAKVHFIERDNNERYVVIISGDNEKVIRAFSLTDGTQATIAQRYRAVVADGSASPVALAQDDVGDDQTYYSYTVTLTQRPPVAFSSTGSDAEYVRVVGGAGADETQYRLLTVNKGSDETPGSITFRVEASDFSLLGDNTGRDQATIDYYIAPASSVNAAYLEKKEDDTNTNARANIKTLTTGDFTFLLNTEKKVTRDTTTSRTLNKNALIFIKQGDYEKKYGLSIKHGSNTYTSEIYSGASQALDATGDRYYNTAKNAKRDTILETLFGAEAGLVYDAGGKEEGTEVGTNAPLNASGRIGKLGDWTAQLIGTSKSVGELKHTANEDFLIHPEDSLGGEGVGVAYKSVPEIPDLPKIAPHKFKIRVRGDMDEDRDDRYVTFILAGSDKSTAAGTVGKGSWIESAGDRVLNRINTNSMPLILKSTGVNTFELTHIPLDALAAGDGDTNPAPSFVDNKIGGLFQFKGRLGFLSGASITMTEVKFGSYDGVNNIQNYNFYRTSVVNLLDGDSIDVTVSSANVVNLRDALAFQDNLVLFSDYGQFVLKGGDILTPKSVSVNPITEFEYDESVSPIALGSFIYFPFQRGGFTGVREFTVNASTDVYDANEVTSHVPQYIPTNILSLTGASSEDVMAITDGTDIYIYKYFFSGQEKVLSSWSKFTLSNGNIRGIGFVDSDLYVVQALTGLKANGLHENQTHLFKIPLGKRHRDAEGRNTHLDRRVKTTLNTTVDSPQITLDYGVKSDEEIQVVTTDGVVLGTSHNLLISTAIVDGAHKTYINFQGNFVSGASGTAVSVYVGTPYTMKYKFSEQVLKAAAGEKASPTNAGRMLIRNGSLFFHDTSHFVVKVTPNLRNTSTSEFNASIVNSTVEGVVPLETNSFRFPVFTDPKGTVITVENASTGPCNLQSAEFEAFVHQRSRRYG